jgi:hypothetical protein
MSEVQAVDTNIKTSKQFIQRELLSSASAAGVAPGDESSGLV